MAGYDYDLFVLGAGSGGVRASRVAAGLGARVAIAEERRLGGTCVNVGCVPKKLFVYASEVAEELRDAAGFGWSIDGSGFDWPTLVANKDREIERLNGVYRRLLLEAGVDILEGRARLVDRHTALVGERRITADQLLVAVGGWPKPLPVPGGELAVSSNEMFHLEQLPARALIVGGGYIAVEFASILRGLGVEVSVVYRGPLFLRGFDTELRKALAEEMAAKGITLCFDCRVERVERLERIERDAGELAVILDDGRSLSADLVLSAVGRVPQTAGLGLEELGVDTTAAGAVVVDELSRSSVANVWAIGDVTDRVNLTPVAIHEGACVARTLFGEKPVAPDYDLIPSAVFTQPTLGTVGLTEEEAESRFPEIEVYRSRFRPLKHTLSGNHERTLVKLVTDGASGRVLGAHMLGPHAGEIVQGLAIALKMGATKADFDATLGIHPTSAEEFVTLR